MTTSVAVRTPPRRRLDDVLAGTRYEAYTYSYPHKTAYRPLAEPVPLTSAWQREDRSALFLYLHVPFCEMRCGFCNLFTQVNPAADLPSAYVATLERQAERVRAAVGDARYVRVAFGGGTPTFLAPALLDRLYDVAERVFGVNLAAVPVSLETSPDTATSDRLAQARRRGVDRLSIGIQSFVDAELKALGRPQTRASALAALERIASAGFDCVNIDLIYGADGQTPASFVASIEQALRFAPTELYLYPLYVRPLTGLGRRGERGAAATDVRDLMYEQGRDLLLAAGYHQVSLRMFRKVGTPGSGPVYCCQEDGMVGLGCGARSYTRGLHYADDWAVSTRSVRGIIADWVQRPAASFERAHYGIALDADEQRRRYVIQSIAIRDGLDETAYRQRFDSDPCRDFSELGELLAHALLERIDHRLVPTPRGLAWADAIGPWLYSERVRRRMQGFELR